jgi:ankyrin repeat protein
MRFVARTIVVAVAICCAAPNPAVAADEKPADAAKASLEQFLADGKAKRVDAVKARLFIPKGPPDPAADEEVQDLVDVINGGMFVAFDMRLLDVHVDGDAAVIAAEFRRPDRQPDIDPFYLLRDGETWKVLPSTDPKRFKNLTNAQRKQLESLKSWYDNREAELRRAGAGKPDPGIEAKRRLNTGLALAAAKGDAAEVERLLAQGADVNGNAYLLDSPLKAAALRGKLDMMRLLVSKGAKVDPPGEPLIFQLLMHDQRDAAKLLIELGTDVNRSWERDTPLGLAARSGFADVVKALLERKADPHAKSKMGGPVEQTTLLNLAAMSGDLATFEAVRPHFPDLKVTDARGRTALHAVARTFVFSKGKDQPAIVDALLNAGLDPHAKMQKDEMSADLGVPVDTPLRIAAASYGGAAVVDALVERVKYDPAELTFALRLGVRTCPASVLQKLLDRGADAKEPGTLYAAAARRNVDAVRLLLERGADPNDSVKSTGRTALHAAVASGPVELVDLLLTRGADASRKDAEGKDALALARIRVEKGREPTRKDQPYQSEFDGAPDAGKQILERVERASKPKS